MDIRGHAAIVTGGGSGLGAATATMLASAGAKVALLDVNMDAAQAHAKTIGGIAVRCDVSDAASAEAAVKEANSRHGTARILLNCAGVGTPKPSRSLPVRKTCLRTNLPTVCRAIQNLSPLIGVPSAVSRIDVAR